MKFHKSLALFLAGVFLGFALMPAAYSKVDSSKADDNRRDGNWWINQPESGRGWYVLGFFDGMELGRSFSYWGILLADKNDECLRKIQRSYGERNLKYMADITAGQVVDGLNEFYKDYRNRRILIIEGTWIVVNEIAGTPRADLDKMIENYRKNATK